MIIFHKRYLEFSCDLRSLICSLSEAIVSLLLLMVSCNVAMVSTSLLMRCDSWSDLSIDPSPKISQSHDSSGKAVATAEIVSKLTVLLRFNCPSNVC